MPDTPISGATSSSYTLVTGDIASNIFCRVTAHNSVGDASADSNTVGPVTAGSAASTWNPADKTTNIELSSGDLIVTVDDSAAFAFQSVRGTTARSTGKYYFEITGTAIVGLGGAIGLADATHSFAAGKAGAVNGRGVVLNIHNGFADAQTSGVGIGPLSFPYADGDVFGFACDLDTHNIWFRKNGTYLNGDGSTGGFSWGAGADAAMFPYAYLQWQGAGPLIVQINTTVTAPSGFTAWG